MPIQGTHGEIVVASEMNGKLLFEVLKGMESVGRIEVFIVLPVGTLHFAVVSRRVWTDELMPYPQLFEARLKERKFSLLVFIKGFDELHAVVRLNALYLEGECLYEHFEKLYRGVSALFLKSSYEAKAGILINGGVLVETLFHDLRVSRDTDGRDDLYVYLYPFPRIMHWFIWLRNIFWIGRLYGLKFLPS